MKKEVVPKLIKASEIVLFDKIKRRERLRQEFLQKEKEKYKNKAALSKKEVIAQLKEVYADAS